VNATINTEQSKTREIVAFLVFIAVK